MFGRARSFGVPAGARGPVGAGFGRFRRHRSDPRGRALQRPGRPHSGLHRAGRRRHRPAHRGQRARGRRAAGVDRVRADQRFRRAADPPDRRAPLPLRRLGRRLARSRILAHHHDHREPGPGAGAGGQPPGGRVPADPRSGHDSDLRRRAAHAVAAAALSVGAGRLQGQVDQPHALRGHTDRHRGPARAVPDDRVRRARGDDLSGGRGARLGGVRLCLHRLRLLAEDVRPRGRLGADLARRRRSDHRRHPDRIPVRLSQPAPLARALHAFRARLARADGGGRRALGVQRAGRGRRRPHLDRDRRGRRPVADPQPRGARLRSGGDADPDLVPARRLGGGGRRRGARLSHQRPRLAGPRRRPGADRHADRLHRDAVRFLRRAERRRRRRRRRESDGRWRWRDRARRSSTGTWSTTRSAAASRWKISSASSAARSKDRPPTGSTCCIRSTGTAIPWRSTGCCTSAPDGSTTSSGCAAPTAIISGTC